MEVGSEFSLDLLKLSKVKTNLFWYLKDYNFLLFDSGRSALRALTEQLSGKILLPEFICESVINCFNKDNIVFYKVQEDFLIDMKDLRSKINESISVIYIMHYFGALQEADSLNMIKDLAMKYNIVIIEDTTHSLFSSRNTIGDYCIASIRKWMPISMGGILYSKNELPTIFMNKSVDNYKMYGMILKQLYLDNLLDCNSIYRTIFTNAEEKLDNSLSYNAISDVSKFIIECQDITQIIKKRQQNYSYLQMLLSERGIVSANKLGKEDCPFVFLIRVEDREQLRRYLIENKIYCAVHWPFDGFKKADRNIAKKNSDTLLSLPVDQRYGKREMEYIANVISQYGGDFYFKSY